MAGGCGVGRVTQGLALHFDNVVGVDVAPGMLAEARRNAQIDGLTNVDYHSSLDPERFAPRSYDFVHSYIVLQHIPVEIGEPKATATGKPTRKPKEQVGEAAPHQQRPAPPVNPS